MLEGDEKSGAPSDPERAELVVKHLTNVLNRLALHPKPDGFRFFTWFEDFTPDRKPSDIAPPTLEPQPPPGLPPAPDFSRKEI